VTVHPADVSAVPQTAAATRLVVELRREAKGPALTFEPVTEADLGDARAEAWLHLLARRGRPELPVAAARFDVEPVPGKQGLPHCTGFRLRVPGGEARHFGQVALEQVAWRATERLRAAGALERTQSVYFTLRAESGPERPDAVARSGVVRVADADADADADGNGNGDGHGNGDTGSTARALVYETRPLAPLLAAARRVGPAAEEGEFVALYTEEALASALRACRRGAASRPAVESGGLLLGALARCPESGEVYALVHDVIEAAHAECTSTSLAFSSRTWAHVDSVLRARRAAPGGAALMLLGQCHGHNFLPANGAAPCADCATAEVCGRSSAFLSPEDLVWCAAVFSGQPWQLGLVAGLNARNEPDDAFFGQTGGVLAPRGVHVLPAAALAAGVAPAARGVAARTDSATDSNPATS
jgi:hypothetical protein